VTLYKVILVPMIFIALYYFFFREGNIFYLWLGIDNHLIYKLNSNVMDATPSFVHVYSFSLITWLALGKKRIAFSILLWSSINLLFEVGQTANKVNFVSLPSFVENYFSYGVFSWLDIIAIFLAAISAYITILLYRQKLNDE
ncbi:MAG: hypothetical protein KAH22_03000, partial [Thiotrichaceae bacterium]|nr:hypothetical protein [Thiotrichaceae bacterium]